MISRDFIIPPGETILEILNDKGVTVEIYAKSIGIDPQCFDDLIFGETRITPEIAEQLECLFNVKKQFWLKLQAKYDRELKEYKEAVKEQWKI